MAAMGSPLPTGKLLFLDAEIDTSRETIRRGSEEYRLRQKTFQVLLYLIQNRDRVVTRDELFTSVWKDAAVTEDTLVQCIVEIRRALGDASRTPRFVRTLPKRGYSFIAQAADDQPQVRTSTVTIEVETTRSLEYEVVRESPPAATGRLGLQIGVAAAGLIAASLIAVTLSTSGTGAGDAPKPQLRPAGGSFASSLTANPEAYRLYSLGVERANELQTREAIALLERAILLDPEFAMAHARIGYALGVMDSRAEDARPHIRRASQLVQRLSEKDRMVVAAWQAIVDSDFEEAIERFRVIVDRYPTDLESHWRLAQLLNGEERTEEAVSVLERAVVIDPNSPQIHNLLGGLYSFLGRHGEAIASRRRYVTATNEPNAWDSLGLSYNWAGDYDEALAAYERALRLKPDFDLALYHRAATYVQLGRFAEALEDVHSYLGRATDRDRGRAFAAIATIHALKGDERRAKEASARVSADSGFLALVAPIHDPGSLSEATMARTAAAFNDRGARLNRRAEFHARGRAALRRGDTEAALQLFRDSLRFRALAWHIDSLETGLADAYLHVGRFAEASDEYARVLSLNPNYARALYGRARANEALGRSAEARADYRRFLALWKHADPDARDLIDARTREARLR